MSASVVHHQSRSATNQAAPRLGDEYQPRPLRFIKRVEFGQWRLKVYGIATPGRVPRPELVDAALARAAEVLPPIDRDRPGIGFVIAHDAASVGIALIYWWQSANELHQRVFTSPLDEPHTLTPVADPAAGCVWELGIIDFERRHWIDDVLKAGDVELYLTRRLYGEI